MKLLTLFSAAVIATDPKGDFFEWMWGNDQVSPIDEYVAYDDGYFSWTGGDNPVAFDNETLSKFDAIGIENVDVYYLNMTSQKWLDESIVTRSVWFHEVYITIPRTLTSAFRDKAFIYIDGGGNRDNSDYSPHSAYYELSLAIKFSSDTGTIGVVVRQIPNESLRFHDDHYADWDGVNDLTGPPPVRVKNADGSYTPELGKKRSEDGIIAYTWWKFAELGYKDSDAHWLLRFPMVKAVSRAMTAAEQFVNKKLGQDIALENWMVAGASKRGWTTWMVGAVDRRVKIICPLVMDLLRINQQMHSHFSNLGGYTFAFEDYYWENLTHYVDTDMLGALSKHVDPWSYRERFRARDITIYVTNTGGDEFFLVDDNHAYFNEFLMPKNRKFQRYLRNTEHSMAAHGVSNSNILRSIEEIFYRRFGGFEDETPEVDFKITYEKDSKYYIARIEMTSNQKPESINMYYARSQSKSRRDFRLAYIGCPDKDDKGRRSRTDTCECSYIQRQAEKEGKETKGICPQALLWKRERYGKRDDSRLIDAEVEFIGHTSYEKGQITYIGEIKVEKKKNFYIAAYMDFYFPSVNGDGSGELPDIDDPIKYLFDKKKRGTGLTVSSAMAILPNDKPFEDCYKDSCIGSLV